MQSDATDSLIARNLPGIPTAVGSDPSPRFVLQRSGGSFASGHTAVQTQDNKHAKKRPRQQSQPQHSSGTNIPSTMTGLYQYQYAAGVNLPFTMSDAIIQAQAKESAELTKAQMIAEAAEKVLRMKPSSSSISTGTTSATASTSPPPPAQTASISSSFLSRLDSLTGNNLLSSTVVFPSETSREGSGGEGSAGGPFKLQGLVGLKSVLNSTGLTRLPAMLLGSRGTASTQQQESSQQQQQKEK